MPEVKPQEAESYPNAKSCNWDPALLESLMREVTEVSQLQGETMRVCQEILTEVKKLTAELGPSPLPEIPDKPEEPEPTPTGE